MKRFLSLFLTIFMALCVFSACSSGSTDKEGSTEQPGQTVPDGDGDKSDPPAEIPEDPEKEQITRMYITINGNKLEVTLAENSAVDELVEILKQGDIVYYADDYGGFEKVGNIGHSLTTSNNTQISTEPGDVILYSGNQIVLFYGSNSWSYTRLGKINGYSASQLASLLGAGKGRMQVTVSLK